MPTVLGIDPGISGALVITDGHEIFQSFCMPVSLDKKDRSIRFQGIQALLALISKDHKIEHVFLERAVSFGMGTKSAFNYGRGFEAVSIAIELARLPLTLIEPAKWTSHMHQGISADLKPKARSAIAVSRLYPNLSHLLPTKPKGGLIEGPMDAFLIAGYGLRTLYKA